MLGSVPFPRNPPAWTARLLLIALVPAAVRDVDRGRIQTFTVPRP